MTASQKRMNRLVKKLCAQEGGKRQLNAGHCRKVLKALAICFVDDVEFSRDLLAMALELRDKK